MPFVLLRRLVISMVTILFLNHVPAVVTVETVIIFTHEGNIPVYLGVAR
jgi:hypothetical protein